MPGAFLCRAPDDFSPQLGLPAGTGNEPSGRKIMADSVSACTGGAGASRERLVTTDAQRSDFDFQFDPGEFDFWRKFVGGFTLDAFATAASTQLSAFCSIEDSFYDADIKGHRL